MMNTEEYRAYCLSLGPDVEERMPFTAFRAAAGVLVFYVCGHMFSLLDMDHFTAVTLKCQPERIAELKEQHPCVGDPYNMSHKHWIGVTVAAPDGAPAPVADNALLCELTANSYRLVKHQYSPRKSPKSALS